MKKKFTKKDIGIALSWARGELLTSDIIKMFGNANSGYIFLARALKEYVLDRDDLDDDMINGEDPRVEDR